MFNVIYSYDFNWFATDNADARQLKKQLLFSLFWYFTVGSQGWKYVCVYFLADTILTETIEFLDSELFVT